MTKQFHRISTVLSTVSLTFFVAIMLTPAPLQAGGYLHFGYGHHDEHGGYGHYGYGYPFYFGLHSYYGHHYYGHHYYGHHYYGHHYGYAYPYYGHYYGGYSFPYDRYSYREPYDSNDDHYSGDSSSDYRSHDYDRGHGRNTYGHGWTLLGNNRASAALTDFGRQAQAAPNKGGPKVGYALASADLGRLDRGVWAMRRALRIDPESLHYVALDRHMDAKVDQIIHQYQNRYDQHKQSSSLRDADTAFMLASLHYLKRDMQAARKHINQAMLANHVSASTKNLRILIDQERGG